MAERPLRIATEHIPDPFGGPFYRLEKIKRYSGNAVREVPSWLTRKFVNRTPRTRALYRKFMFRRGLKNFDVLHSRTHPWFIELCRRSRKADCRWVHTYHAIFHEEDYRQGLEPWHIEQNRVSLETGARADVKISVSRWGRDLLRDRYGIEAVVIENGVDLSDCDAARPRRFSEKYGMDNFILYVGNFREVKNPVMFIELARRFPEHDFVMIGDGMTADKLRKVYGTGVPENVRLMGRMRHTEVLDAMSACLVYVMTSLHEGLPNTLMEAMAMARPAVVPSHSGCLELVPDERYGFLYDVSSIEELTDRTRRALKDTGRGRRARERVEKNYNWKTLVRKLDDLYAALARGKVPAGDG